jgi:hypothetical protein
VQPGLAVLLEAVGWSGDGGVGGREMGEVDGVVVHLWLAVVRRLGRWNGRCGDAWEWCGEVQRQLARSLISCLAMNVVQGLVALTSED